MKDEEIAILLIVSILSIVFIAVGKYYSNVTTKRTQEILKRSDSFKSLLELMLHYEEYVNAKDRLDDSEIATRLVRLKLMIKIQSTKPKDFNLFQTETLKDFLRVPVPSDEEDKLIYETILFLMGSRNE